MYSKTLGQTIENFCTRCEERFNRWIDYHAHVSNITCALKIRPINKSGRSKSQIVSDWETKNKGAIIG